jgi:hypothetical protein
VTILREAVTAGVTTGHDSDHLALHRRYNADTDVYVSVTADGTTDNTTAIQNAIDAASPGSVLRFPAGPIGCHPLTVEKCLHLRGAGRFTTRFVPLSNTSSPILDWTLTTAGTGIYDFYGPSIAGIGMDLSAAPSATGMKIRPAAQWFQCADFMCNGGATSIDHHGPNATFSDLVLLDASTTFFNADKDGLELHLNVIRIASNTRAVAAYMTIDFTGGTGAVYLDDVTCNANLAGGFGPGRGIDWTSSSLVEPFIFADRLIIDNVTGGGPCLTLTNMQSTTIQNSYMNGTNGCVKLDGCHNPHFDHNRYRGGSPGTYIFGAVAVTDGFVSTDCEIASTPAYKVGASNKPTNFFADDRIVGATTPGQITNDVDWLTHSGSLLWGPRYFRDRVGMENTPPVIGNQMSGVATLGAGGVVTVTCPATSASLSKWLLTRQTVSGPEGDLHISAKNDGVNFQIGSSDAADRSTVYWVMNY